VSARDAGYFLEEKQEPEANLPKVGGFTVLAFSIFRATVLRLSWRG
jgi:hypothetical protein